ncbi:MAG: DUF2141 domain-containing protein, partial [Ignavibacteriaceae bacterium]|nr:DUF2141 domain-containing protein [Ignavibacteriaceae bacterium]
LSKMFSSLFIRIIFLLSIVIIVTTINLAQTSEATTQFGKLKVVILGFNNNEGDCWFAIDNSREVYESEDTVWIGKILSIENKEVIVVIDSLKYGEYAVRVFHDENKNGKIDSNFLGIPTEDYGYSNDASGWFGPPSWEKAKFIFDKPEMTIDINID